MRSPVGQRRTGGRATEMWMPASSGQDALQQTTLLPKKRSRDLPGSTGDKPGCRFARAQADPGPVFGPERRCRGFNNLRALAQIRGETGSLETAPSATQSRRCSRSGIALGQPRVFPWISGAFSGRGRGAGEARHARSEVAAGEQAIVSRAGFRGPGWDVPVAPARGRGGRWIGPRHSRGIPVVPENPGISRTIFFGPTASMSSAARGVNGHSRVNGATLGIVDHTVTHGASHDREPLSGLVERVTFHSPETGFCVLRVKVRGHRDLVTVLGSAASIQPGEFIQASGRWDTHREHGLQFRTTFLKVLPAQLSRRHREIPWQRHDQRHRPAFRQEAGHGVR